MPVRAQGSDDATVTDPRASAPAGAAILAPGALLAGRYRIQRFIAAGGMGEVHEAIDTLLDEPIALKLLREDLSQKPVAQERFAQEIRLARKVTHRNVCRVFDVGVDGHRVFFTMELHAGETLAWHLARKGPLDPDAACPLLAQILAGVAAAHDAAVVHADLKPSNILVTGADAVRVVVTDFGLAMPCCAEIGCACSSAHLLGTPAYMAPEQVTGGTFLDTTDVFSLGVILFEMVTGRLPFGGATALEMARARLCDEPPSPRAVRPDVDPRWDEAIRACLRRDPAQRPSSTVALARALDVALA